MITLNRTQKSKETPLRDAKVYWNKLILSLAEVARKGSLTQLFGQEMIYQEKARQAQKFLDQVSEPDESVSGYEYIFSEVGVTANTARAVAEIIKNKASQYDSDIGPSIERLRLVANKSLKEATTTEEMRECVEEFEQDLELL